MNTLHDIHKTSMYYMIMCTLILSLISHELLFQCELGRPMRRGYAAYPGDTFRYGRPNAQADGGAGEGRPNCKHACTPSY